MIAEWLIPRVEFSFGGQLWALIFTHRCLLECERLTGIDMLTVDMINPPARLLRALLFCALIGAGASMSLEDAGDLLGEIGLAAAKQLTVRAWIASMPEPEKVAEHGERPKFTWLDAWAVARHDLKLSDEEWLDMTPRQLRSLQKLRLEQLQREELLVGIITSHVVNFSMGAPKKQVKATEFMLHPLPEPEPQPITAEYIAEQFKQARLKGGNV